MGGFPMKLPLQVENWPDKFQQLWAERAAIKEFDGNMTRSLAELAAEIDIRKVAEEVWH
jgi:hypothetical protein